jgi:PAS domain S-box-containing protein
MSRIIIVAGAAIAAASIGAFVFFIILGMLRGVRRSRARLQEQKWKLDTALNNMSQGLLMCDSQERVVLCNRRYMEIYGIPESMIARGCLRRELIEHHYAAGILVGDPKQHVASVTARPAAGQSSTRTLETSDGRIISVINHAIENGFRVSTHDDITGRRRAEGERDRNRDFLDLIIESVPVAIFVKDARTFRYILVNRTAEKLWGLSREEVVGMRSSDLFDKETADLIEEHDRKLAAAAPQLFVPVHPIKTPGNGVRLVTTRRLAILDENDEVQYLFGMLEDVTERKAVEDQLRQAQKMEAIGNLTGGVAHDFNNLLTVIIGNLDLLQDDIAGNQAAEQKVDTILQASERGADLTRLMLAFSRRQPLQARPVDVDQLIRSTTRLLNRTLGEEISIDLRPGSHVEALVDEAQLETALLNIAINARDAMPNGGTLTIATRTVELDANNAAGLAPGAYAAIEISDTGTGMPPQVMERIFEPFFTTKPVGKGTGLGLSMVYGFLKQSGGHISVESEPGRGTAFRLLLPLAAPASAKAAPERRSAFLAPRMSGGEVILAVDDNPDVRSTVLVQLRDLGYQVIEADSAASALKILQGPDRIDLLFTDMIMPGGLNGKELALKARATRPDLKVLFTSGFPNPSRGHGAGLDDRDELLNKPYRRQDLARALAGIFAGRAG